MSAADVPSYDGWHAWRVPRLAGIKLDQLRQRLIADEADAASEETDDGTSDDDCL